MNNIKVDTLVERLSKSDIQNVRLHFEGTVGFDIEIKSFKIKKTIDNIEIYNKQEQKVVLNIHQIMKVTWNQIMSLKYYLMVFNLLIFA